MKSKKQLFKDLESFDSEYFKGVSLKHKNINDETYGKKSMIYIYWKSPEHTEKGETYLKKLEYKVGTYSNTNPTISEVQVSYFKGKSWDE